MFDMIRLKHHLAYFDKARC